MNLNPLELLRNDHVAVRGLLKDLEEMAPESSKAKVLALLRLIEREVKIHTTLEEQLFYPAFRKASAGEADRDLSMTAMRDHHAIDRLLPGLIVLAGNKGLFLPRLRAVRSLVTDHTEMEEQAMFARARELLSAAQLDALGRAITVRKEELYKSWTGTLTSPLHRLKSLLDGVAPLALKKVQLERRTHALGVESAARE